LEGRKMAVLVLHLRTGNRAGKEDFSRASVLSHVEPSVAKGSEMEARVGCPL
jgi:hypothetical protein